MVKGDHGTVNPLEVIERKIFLIRGKRSCWMPIWQIFTMWKPGVLSRPSSVNMDRFPSGFMFQLSAEEFVRLWGKSLICDYSLRRLFKSTFIKKNWQTR